MIELGVRLALLAVFPVSVLVGCAGTGITGDNYELVADPPAMGALKPVITKTEDDRSLAEQYRWVSRPAGWPAATLLLMRIKDNFRGNISYIRTKSLSEQIAATFPGRKVTLRDKGVQSNALGEISYQRFSIDKAADCIFIEKGMSRFADQVEFNSDAEPLGDMIVRGWYCALPAAPNQYDLFREFIASTGIRGYAVP